MLEVRAYAKLNLTLEVLGRRDDGYHEIRSIMQSLCLHDTLRLSRADAWSVTFEGATLAIEDDLIARAGRLLEEEIGRPLPTRVICYKRIPVAAGLGGGSSDAAAALVGLRRLWNLPLRAHQLHRLGVKLGSDVPFLLRGGTLLASGRGEILSSLPPLRRAWVIIAMPTLTIATASKTAAVYGRLRPCHYTRGEYTAEFVAALVNSFGQAAEGGWNVFEQVADEVFPGLGAVRQELSQRSGLRFHLSGTGPSLYALLPGPQAARACLQRLRGVSASFLVTTTASTRPRPRQPLVS